MNSYLLVSFSYSTQLEIRIILIQVEQNFDIKQAARVIY